jgi:hypothetical protein
VGAPKCRYGGNSASPLLRLAAEEAEDGNSGLNVEVGVRGSPAKTGSPMRVFAEVELLEHLTCDAVEAGGRTCLETDAPEADWSPS